MDKKNEDILAINKHAASLKKWLRYEKKGRKRQIRKIRALRKTVKKQADELEKFCEAKKQIIKLQELVAAQKKELETLHGYEKIIRFTKNRCIKALIITKDSWWFRRWAAMKFLKLTARIFKRAKILTLEESNLIFPAQKEDALKEEKIHIRTKDEKKRISRAFAKGWGFISKK